MHKMSSFKLHITASMCGLLFACSAICVAAQTSEIVRAENGKPDLTGIWAGPGFEHTGGEFDNPAAALYSNDNMAPLKTGAESLLIRPRSGDLRIDDPTAICLPNGLTRQIPSPYPQQWIQTDDLLVILYEYMHF